MAATVKKERIIEQESVRQKERERERARESYRIVEQLFQPKSNYIQ